MALFKEVKLPLCLLIVLFGMGSWVAVNGVWVELPILVHQLPEGWTLPSYMTIVIQVANIGPFLYTIGHLAFPATITERPSAYFIITLGCLATILMPFLWHNTSFVGGTEHGVAFLVLLFLLSVTDCTSSVVFLPFMNNFKPQYLTSYYIGGGFSGLLPSIVAFAQGVGRTECTNTSSQLDNLTGANTSEYTLQEVYLPPVFSARDFFLIIFLMMMLCGAAFIALDQLAYCRREYVSDEGAKLLERKELRGKDTVKSSGGEEESTENASVGSSNGNIFTMVENGTDEYLPKTNTDDILVTMKENEPLDKYSNNIKDILSATTEQNGVNGNKLPSKDSDITHASTHEHPSSRDQPPVIIRTGTYIYYLILIAWLNAFTNGILIAIQSFACLPYGDQTYQLSATLCNIINPVGCFAAFFVTVRSTLGISLMTGVGSALSAYIVVMAAQSPNPPLLDTILGPILIVAAYTLVYLLFTYVKVNIATLFRLRDKRSLLWCGVATQIGSATGSILMFVIVNVYQLFEQQYPCG